MLDIGFCRYYLYFVFVYDVLIIVIIGMLQFVFQLNGNNFYIFMWVYGKCVIVGNLVVVEYVEQFEVYLVGVIVLVEGKGVFVNQLVGMGFVLGICFM